MHVSGPLALFSPGQLYTIPRVTCLTVPRTAPNLSAPQQAPDTVRISEHTLQSPRSWSPYLFLQFKDFLNLFYLREREKERESAFMSRRRGMGEGEAGSRCLGGSGPWDHDPLKADA